MSAYHFRKQAWKWFDRAWLRREGIMRFDDGVWQRWTKEWLPRIKEDIQQTVIDKRTFADEP
jgi:hypothetical protein